MTAPEAIWVEKHRPQTLDDIVGHDTVVERMKDWVDDEAMPNLLFAGPQGVGKTALVTAFAKEKYGEDGWRSNVMELNASDERGIDTVRNKIKKFARQGTVGDHQFKIVFLDEVDSMTGDAQPALRRVMEDYSEVTRFILSCNYSNQIIDPIQSRTTTFHIGRLSDAQIKGLLENIAEKEELDYEDEQLWNLVKAVRGDARSAVHNLQSSISGGEVRDDYVDALISVVDDEFIEELIDKAIAGEMDEAMRSLDTEVIKEGVNPQTVADSFLRVLKNHDDLTPDARVKAIDKLAETDWRILRGANPNIHFHALLGFIHLARHHNAISNYEEQREE